jgi:hypothetical protein
MRPFASLSKPASLRQPEGVHSIAASIVVVMAAFSRKSGSFDSAAARLR